ncbi:MAG: serine/threonine-protein kinase [Kofleriaceae bacterium]
MANPTPGTILGAYRIEGQLGAGSMGEVFKAVDTGLERRVAIKLLSEKHRDSPELRKRFVREGRAVAAISHPNVVQVFATGSFDDRPYIAMELLDGIDLGSMVEKRGPLSSAEAAHSILDAAAGLSAAARAGLIHRDVKPSNLVRLDDGKVKVTDFGLAKPLDPGSEPALTAMGVVVGTPDYIAPEQARGEPIDERVDLYALGGTLYFLMTGIPPFRTGRPADDKYLKVVARHLRNPAPDALERNPNADRELAQLAMQLMAKKAGERPSYVELTQRLSGILARLDPGSVPELIAATRERSRPNATPPVGGGAALYGNGQHGYGRPADESATVSDGAIGNPRGLPAWMVVVTLGCLALFVAGLVTFLTRAEPVAKAGTTTGSGSGSSGFVTDQAADAGAAQPASLMVLVKHPDGTPWFMVDKAPVPATLYKKLFSNHEQPGDPDAPVVQVSYDGARSYASTRGGRLLRSEEWDAATTTPGVVVSDGIFEWVESPERKRTVRAHGKTQVRPDGAQKDVTFRVAKDL